jgi:hypothetical protein
MFVLSKYLCEFICHIYVHVKVEIVDYSVFLQILTIVITTIDVLGASLYDLCGNESESSLIATVDSQWW